MRQRETGFTIIELIVVIILLGILAATALPRFFDVTDDAGQSAVEGLRGNIEMAAKLTRAAGFAQNLTNAASVPMEGATITTCNGYPTADYVAATGVATGIISAAQISNILPTADGGFTGAGTLTWQIADATNPATCFVTYAAAPGATVPANCDEMGNEPIITSNIAGC
jgi:MSHA pilin protein MshA